MNISNAVVVITAGGSPTGRAMAEHFCSLGASVALIDTDRAALQLSVDTCNSQRGKCALFTLDDYKTEEIHLIFHHIQKEFGGIDVLINLWQGRSLPELLLAEEPSNTMPTAISDITSYLYFFGRHAAFSMRDQGRKGVIINMSSAAENAGSAFSTHAMIAGLTKSWANELEHCNIRVGGIVKAMHRTSRAPADYELIRNAEYIVSNDSFNGRLLEAEC